MNELKHRDELPLLLNSLDLVGVGVEVGSCQGEFADTILKNWNGQKLWLVDAWRHFQTNIEDINNSDHNKQLEALIHCFIKMYPYGSRVGIIRDLSVVGAKLFDDHSLDFVYIDAAHDYESVIQDLISWFPKVKKGGVLAGHDYTFHTVIFEQNGGYINGVFEVKPAVDEFAKEHTLEIKVTGEDFQPSWWTIV